MDKVELRESMVFEIASKMGGIGKTGMMKAMYFLQQVYKVSLDYDFNIYNYGPFDEDVLVAVDCAKKKELIDIQLKDYGDGISGYEIIAKEDMQFPASAYSGFIDEISRIFSDYTAKKWELASTIVYLYVAYHENPDWDINELDENVMRIKPHFTISEIEKERKHLESLEVLSKAI
ncbi:MAG: hypothetical protein FWE32_00020 [Oscillospiraceae bacterium]|nr:hypothetical protein [Oscillospiraceae bacterium]